MRILIAPDKFKNSLTAAEVAQRIAFALKESLPEAEIESAPVADGGDGTADVLCHALNGEWRNCSATDPIGRKIAVRYAWIEREQLAIVESSEVIGLHRLHLDERHPITASSLGLGEMLLATAGTGAGEILVGLGGSATNDGGFGMARGLGYRFLDSYGRELLHSNVTNLLALERIIAPPKLQLPKITVAADVRNPLLGSRGATYIFAEQKGANAEELETSERSLKRLAERTTADLHCDFRDVAGAGAAGGLGFGLLSFCGARIVSGFEVVAAKVGLEERIRLADVVITGEGSLDRQTLGGKAPAGVAQMSRRYGKRVFAIVGQNSDDEEVNALFEKVFPLVRDDITPEQSIAKQSRLLHDRTLQLASYLARP